MIHVMTFNEIQINISNESCIIDTNVLIGLFRKNDQHCRSAQEFMDAYDDEYIFYIPVPVIIETWGSLVGGFSGNFDSGFKFLEWLQKPNVIILPESCINIESNSTIMKMMNVDIVDALILDLANEITEQCSLPRPLIIATFDTKDFYKLMRLKKYKFRLLNLETLHIEEFL